MERLLVVIPGWVLGDGAVAPPSCGDRVGYHLAFYEHDPADGPDPAAQQLPAQTDSYAEPWLRPDRTRAMRLAWPTTLRGRSWAAHWSAPRELHGAQQLTGTLMVDPMLRSQPATYGTVTDLHVISVEVEAKGHNTHPGTPRSTVPGSYNLRPVWVSPQWLDNGPTKKPTRTGWHSYSELELDTSYRKETGVLVTLDLEQQGAVNPKDAGHGVVGR